jgi:Zn-dependent peptidase ImmA (M78 family)
MFNPSRLTLARERRGFSKTELARLVDATPRVITGYERGEYVPPDRTLERLALKLSFPPSFFFGSDLQGPPADGVSFRALTRMTRAQRDVGIATARLGIALSDWIDSRFELPDADIPQVPPSSEPETAATIVRTKWGLGEVPAGNLIHLVEAHGVRVLSMAEDCRELDAFSFWRNDVPFIFLNTMKTAEHGRFDVAHELGHLVLHRGAGSPRGRQEEREANAFASAFLMPRADVLARAPRFPSLADIAKAKKRWNVAALALTYRLHKLELITDWHYRELCIEISRYGRAKEINPGVREHSQVFSKVFSALRSEGISRSDVAKALDMYPAELESLIFGLFISGVEGGGEPSPRPNRKLRLA